jgi:hypothetical protein
LSESDLREVIRDVLVGYFATVESDVLEFERRRVGGRGRERERIRIEEGVEVAEMGSDLNRVKRITEEEIRRIEEEGVTIGGEEEEEEETLPRLVDFQTLEDGEEENQNIDMRLLSSLLENGMEVDEAISRAEYRPRNENRRTQIAYSSDQDIDNDRMPALRPLRNLASPRPNSSGNNSRSNTQSNSQGGPASRSVARANVSRTGNDVRPEQAQNDNDNRRRRNRRARGNRNGNSNHNQSSRFDWRDIETVNPTEQSSYDGYGEEGGYSVQTERRDNQRRNHQRNRSRGRGWGAASHQRGRTQERELADWDDWSDPGIGVM